MLKVTMKTIDREFLGVIVKQRTQDSYFSFRDLALAGNRQRMSDGLNAVVPQDYFQQKQNKEFIKALEKEIGNKAYIAQKGRGKDSWVHPFLFIDIALWFSPKIKLSVYKWLYDYLIENRIRSSESYKYMTGCLYVNAKRKDTFSADIKKLALLIQQKICVTDWNKATNEQLQQRDRLQMLIGDYANAFKNNKNAIMIALETYSRTQKYAEITQAQEQ